MTWYDDRSELLGFGHVLICADYLISPREVLDYVESPVKWAVQHQLWENAGRPGPADGKRWQVLLDLYERHESDPTKTAIVAVAPD